MAYCKNCGMPIDEKRDVRCPRCGEFTDGKSNEKNNSNKVIIVVLVALLIVVVALGIVLTVLTKRTATEAEVTEILSQQMEPDAQSQQISSAIEQEVWTENNYAGNGIDNSQYVPPATDYQQIYTFSAGQNGLVSFDTPGHSGVNLRKYNDAGSEVLLTLPEGTGVTLAESVTIKGDGYALVNTTVNGVNYKGYILAKYIMGVGGIADDGRGDEPDDVDTPVQSGNYVSYNTPEGKGLNMRSEPSYYSDLICTLPEGTAVDTDFAGNDGSNEDYLYVGAYVDGVYCQGYVLSKYIE